MGAVTYPLTMPTSVGFKTSRFSLERNVAVNRSTFSGKQQVYDFGLALWKATLTLPPMSRSQAGEWQAFFVSLRGRLGTFKMGDPDAKIPRGEASNQNSGIARTDGARSAHIETNDITIDNLPFGYDGDIYLYAGEWISIHDRLYMVRENAVRASNHVNIKFEPALKDDVVDNQTFLVANTVGLWRMDANELGWDVDHVSKYGFTFSCTEAL